VRRKGEGACREPHSRKRWERGKEKLASERDIRGGVEKVPPAEEEERHSHPEGEEDNERTGVERQRQKGKK